MGIVGDVGVFDVDGFEPFSTSLLAGLLAGTRAVLSGSFASSSCIFLTTLPINMYMMADARMRMKLMQARMKA
jgi:hypothetical protein